MPEEPQAQMGKTTEDVQESTGKLVEELESDFLPIFNEVLGDFKSAVEWGTKHKEVIEGVIKVVGGVVAAWGIYTITTKAAAAADFLFLNGMFAKTAATEADTLATGEATEAMGALDVAMDANPIGLMITAIAALAAGFYELVHATEAADKAKKDFENHVSDPLSNQYAANPALRSQMYVKAYNQQNTDRLAFAKYSAEFNADKNNLNEDGLADAKRKMDEANHNMNIDTQLLLKYDKIDKTPTGKPPPIIKSTDKPTPAIPTTDTKGEHQNVITFNIKDFGKTDVHAATVEMALPKIGEAVQAILAEAINNAQILTGQ